MRGKAIDIGPIHGELGITPAYAGKRYCLALVLFFARDHPRVCGEKLIRPLCLLRLLGSPPRMRGKVSPASLSLFPAWITPAYAGKSPIMDNCYMDT